MEENVDFCDEAGRGHGLEGGWGESECLFPAFFLFLKPIFAAK